MKKLFLLSACVLSLFSASYASAQTMSATSAPVTMTAIVPEFIGLNVVSANPILFDFTAYAQSISNGEAGMSISAASTSSMPSWTLNYNLKHRDVTVCAYASDLAGTGTNNSVISSKFIGARSIQGGSPWVWFGAVGTCHDQPNAIMLDQIKGATSSANANNRLPRSEGFVDFTLDLSPAGYAPLPDTYTGHLYIVAQAI